MTAVKPAPQNSLTGSRCLIDNANSQHGRLDQYGQAIADRQESPEFARLVHHSNRNKKGTSASTCNIATVK